MNIPKLRFKEFNDEWIEGKISDLIELNPKNYSLPESFIYIDLDSVSHGRLLKKKVINRIDAPSRAQRNVKLYDILYQTVRPYQKNNLYIDKLSELPYIASTGYAVLREKNIYSKFLFNKLYTYNFVNEVLDNCTGTSYPAINANDLGTIKIYYPSNVEEQRKIGDFLSLLDKKIELQTKKIEALKLFKKGLIVQTKSDTTQWSTIKIGNIFHSTRGVVISKSNISSKKENNFLYPVYSSQTSNNGILGYDKTYDFNGKYLTWTTDGANAGKVFYRKGKFRCTNVCGILFNDNDKYINKLMAELLNLETPKYVSYVGNPKLMNNIMENITMKIPPLKKQIFISNFLEIIDNKIELEISILSNLKHLKKGLLQNMFV